MDWRNPYYAIQNDFNNPDMHNIVHTSSLNLLARLICPGASRVIAYDPKGRLIEDEAGVFRPEPSMPALLRDLAGSDSSEACVFNLSDEPLAEPMPGWLIEFDDCRVYPDMDSTTWHYINNPDGSPRWLYPSHLRRPRFLAFYNFNYWKARLYKFMVNMAFLLRWPALVSNGCIIVHSKCTLYVEDLIRSTPDVAGDFAIFTGTAGPNRKVVIAEGQEGGVKSFLKIALNECSAKNIDNEFESLSLLRDLGIKDLVFPAVARLDETTIRVSNIKPLAPRLSRGFASFHWRFLREFFDASFERKNYSQLVISCETRERLRWLASHPRLGERGKSRELFDKLVAIERHLHAIDPVVGTAMSHGDFTPWNVYSKGDTVFAYDWEFCRPAMPVLFDFFHYVIQGKVFAVNASAPELQAELDNLLSEPVRARFLREQGLDADFYQQLYLLFNGAYYLEIYLEQEVLHKEGYRLFSLWSEMLGAWSPAITSEPMRKTFIRSFFDFLASKNYVVLKTAGKSMDNLSRESDLDILLAKSDCASTMEWISHYPGVEKLRYTKKSFMTTAQLFFADQSYLSIDILKAFHRKSLEYIPASEMLEHAGMVNGVRVLPPAYDYLYIYLFYHLNYTGIPTKYSIVFDDGDPDKERAILGLLHRLTGIKARQISETFAWSIRRHREVITFLRRARANRLSLRLTRWVRYTGDSLSDLFSRRGVMMTFSGVDGAGKSTILGEVRDLLQQKYRRKVVVLRHRPCLLPILSAWRYGKDEAEKKCVASLPRKGNNRSRLSSLFRFGYYYSDYLLGQLLIYAKYMLKGYVVLYDRYYFDFIVDGKRSNILLRPSFIRKLYCFVYKPQMNVFLYAAPEVILKRKQELTAEDITQLTDHYKTLFGRLGAGDRYICIENTDKQGTMDQIEQAYVLLN
jgi:thymidylate kinase